REEVREPLLRPTPEHVDQNGFANTSHTTAISANSGSSLNQRSAVGEGSDLPFATPLSQRPATMKCASISATSVSLACSQPPLMPKWNHNTPPRITAMPNMLCPKPY